MKNTPPKPLLLVVLLSALLTHELGNVNSNAPKNEAAKTINIKKKMIFIHDVEIQLKILAVVSSPPPNLAIKMRAAIGSV